MQALIMGRSGSGKGYEVCAFHIMAALQKGRKVITNMPLVLEKWAEFDPAYPALIEIRRKAQPIRGTWEPTREEGAYHLFEDDDQIVTPPPTARAFAGVWDYYSTWKHPDTGAGPLIVVDEAQNVIPMRGTSSEVAEWSALHRHFNVDVIFITQSYGKLSKDIRDNIEMVYRLTKKVAWGQPNRYIRKVQEGLRGEVLNEGERVYNPNYFGLWQSQTQGGSGAEYAANDITPYWKHWSFKGAALCFFAAVALGMFNVLKSSGSSAEAAAAAAPPPVAQSVAGDPSPAFQAVARGPAEKLHPYQGNTLHLSGVLFGVKTVEGKPVQYLDGLITIAQGGQPVAQVRFEDLRRAGYQITYHSNQVVSLTFKGLDIGYVVDDLPRVSLKPQGPAIAANP